MAKEKVKKEEVAEVAEVGEFDKIIKYYKDKQKQLEIELKNLAAQKLRTEKQITGIKKLLDKLK